MNRGDLSNERWERLKLLLPQQKPKTGKPSNDQRTINRLKQFRRIATCYGKLAADYTAMMTIASILLWL